jgi:hypothetical protein
MPWCQAPPEIYLNDFTNMAERSLEKEGIARHVLDRGEGRWGTGGLSLEVDSSIAD